MIGQDDDDDDEIILWKQFSPYFQQGPWPQLLTITNLQEIVSRYYKGTAAIEEILQRMAEVILSFRLLKLELNLVETSAINVCCIFNLVLI